MTNCLLYALALYWRRSAKGKRCYLALRRSDFTWVPHFLVFELRGGQFRAISYKPLRPRMKPCPPAVFDGAPRWGDVRTLFRRPRAATSSTNPKENCMSDSNYKPDGTGVVMGDTKPMPDRGTGVGMTGYDPQLGGMSIDVDATNSLGKITNATQSDPAAEDTVDDPTFGPAAGDAAEDKQEGY